MKKLNLGCGSDIKKGYLNLDIANLEGVDVVHDIEKIPFPFNDNEFNEILCNDILEHVEYIPILKELHRILKKGGRLKIKVPHFTSSINYIDPTHRRVFSVRTFDFFVKGTKYQKRRSYYFDFTFSKRTNASLTYAKQIIYNAPVFAFINLNTKFLPIYEDTFLSRIFPAQSLKIELIK